MSLCGESVTTEGANPDRNDVLLDAEIVLVAIDGARDAILTPIEPCAIGPGEVAAIGAAHVAFFTVDGSLTAFQVACFASG